MSKINTRKFRVAGILEKDRKKIKMTIINITLTLIILLSVFGLIINNAI